MSEFSYHVAGTSARAVAGPGIGLRVRASPPGRGLAGVWAQPGSGLWRASGLSGLGDRRCPRQSGLACRRPWARLRPQSWVPLAARLRSGGGGKVLAARSRVQQRFFFYKKNKQVGHQAQSPTRLSTYGRFPELRVLKD
jgi:hypothetical protein